VSIGAPSAAAVSSGPVTYTVTYADANFNTSTLSPSDITLNRTGTATASIGVSGSGAARTVTLSNITGDGTLGISIVAGTATDLAGNTAPAATSATFTVDNTGPAISSVSKPADGRYKAGQNLDFTATFNEKAMVGGTPAIALTIGSTVRNASYVSGSGTSALLFRYTVVSGDNDTDGITVAPAIGLNGGTITDTLGNNASLGFTAPNTSGVLVDATPPTAALTYSPASAAKSGSKVTITATFSEPMAASPPPKIAISAVTGGTALAPTNMTMLNATTYTYLYTVQAGNGTANVTMSVGTDLAGNVVTAAPTDGATFTVDNTAPTAAITYSASAVKLGGALTITATFNELMAASVLPKLAISAVTGGTALAATAMTNTGDNKTYTYVYTGQAGNGAATVTLSAGTDVAGNLVIATPTSGASFTVDNTAPKAAITYSPSGVVKAGTTLTLTATFTEAMADVPAPQPQFSVSGGNTASGVPMNRVSATQYTASYVVGAGSGTATVALSNGTDVAGNVITAAPTSGATFTVDNTAPTASITYSPAGPVKQGTTLTMTATFSEAMAASPVVQFAVSGANSVVPTNMTKTDATHYSGSYVVGPGDGTAIVTLSTGTDVAGNPITATPTSGATFTVDNTGPAISTVTPPPAGSYKAAKTLDFTVNFTENATVAGTPTIGLTIGSIAHTASYVSGSGTSALLFRYTVASGDNGAVGIAAPASINLNGGTIKDALSNNASLGFTPPDTSAVLVDNTPPTAALTYSASAVKLGGALTITATFNEPMGSTAPKIAISAVTGGTALAATTMSKTDATHYAYVYSGQAGNGTAMVTLSVGTDLAGNVVSATPTSGASFTVDNTAPKAAITYSPTGVVRAGTTLTMTATFTEAMADVPAPQPQFSVTGGNTASGVAMTRVSATQYTASYLVGAGSGTATVAFSTGIDLSGNVITAAPSSGATFTVDNTAPTASITYSPAGPVKQGTPLTLTATFSEAMADSPVVQFAVSGANSVAPTNMIKTDATHYKGSYIVGPGDGTAIVALSTGTDAAGNSVTATPTTGATFIVDNTGPAISSVTPPAAGSYKAAKTLDFTVNFNESATVAGTPTIGLTIGLGSRNASYVSGSGTTALLFRYTIAAGDNDTDGIAVASPISLNTGGSIRDALGNDADLNFTPPDTTKVLVDTTAPTAALTYSPASSAKSSSKVTITATFSESLAASPVVQLAISAVSGGKALAATNMTKLDATHYTYVYTVQAGSGAAAVTMSTGTDVAGNVVAATPTSGGILTVDNTAPTAALTYSPSAAKSGSPMTITATFSEPMADSPIPKLAISAVTGGTALAATNMTKGADNKTYTYTYAGQAGNGTATVTMSIGTDVAGNVVTATPTSGATFTVDNTPPTASITYSPAGPVKAGTTLTMSATFSEAMAVSPVVQFAVSGANQVATPTNMNKTDSTHYTGSYVVGAGDGTATVALSTGTDAAGNPITAAPTSGATFTVDNTGPAISTVSPPADGSYKVGGTLTFTVTFNEKVIVTGTPAIGLMVGSNPRTASYVSGSGGTALLFSYTILGGDNGGITVASSITPNGTIKDAAGNDAALSLGALNTSGVLIDGIAPTVTINQAAGQSDPTKGSPINFTVVFSEPVKGFTNAGVTTSGTATFGTKTVTITPATGPATTYNVTIAGMSGTGSVIAAVVAGAATDAAGNGNTASTSTDATIIYDVTAPTSAPTVPASGAGVNALASISGTASDTGSAVAFVQVSLRRGSDGLYWNGSSSWVSGEQLLSTNGTASWSSAAPLPSGANLPDGSYTVRSVATDYVGNVQTTTTNSTFTVDSTSPATVPVTSPVDGSSYSASTVPATFSGSAADNANGLGLNANSTTFTLQRASDGFYWNGTTWQATVSNLATTHTATTSGTATTWTDNVNLPVWASEPVTAYTVRATATDKAGNTFTGNTVTFSTGGIAPTSIAASASGSTTVTSLTQIGITVAAGKTMFALIAADATASTITVSDSAGNTYTLNADQTAGSGKGIRTLVFSAPVATALSNGTITVASTAGVNIAASFFAFNGLVSPAPVDKVKTAFGTTATTLSSGNTAITSLPDELLIGAMAIEGIATGSKGWTPFTPGSGFTALTASSNSGSPSNFVTMQPEYRIVNATNAYAATGTVTASATAWAAAVATYKIVVPSVSSITRAGANPTNGPADFTVTFSESVKAVDAADFKVTTTSGSATGSVSAVTQVNLSTYTVTVGNMTGNGTLRLDVVDNDTIKGFSGIALGGTGTGNGSYTAGQTYTTPAIAPQITSGSSATFALNTAGTFTVTATGAPPPTISQSGTLPAGVSFNGSALSGIPSQAGVFPIVFTATNGATPSTTQSFTLTVTKGTQATVTVTAPSSATYGQTGVTATASGGSGSGAYSFSAGSSTACSVDPSTGAITITASGGCAITATRAGDDDYDVSSPSAPVDITIAPATATVTADNQTMTSGDVDPAFTFQVSGLVGSDSLTGVSCGVGSAHTDPGTYTISCAGNANTNYVSTYVDGTLTVIAAGPENQPE